MFRDKFWLSLVLTLPVLFWSAHIQALLGYQAPEFAGSTWVAPVLATAVFLYGGLVFLKGALRELNDRLPGMMTLISLAIAVAFLFSWVVQFGLIGAEYHMGGPALLEAEGGQLPDSLRKAAEAAADRGQAAIHLLRDGGALAAWGILLTPAAGAVLMSGSTGVVAINAQLLKRVNL